VVFVFLLRFQPAVEVNRGCIGKELLGVSRSCIEKGHWGVTVVALTRVTGR